MIIVSCMKDWTNELFLRRNVTCSLSRAKPIVTSSCLIARSPFMISGKFLSMKDEGVEPVELAERFFLWLDHVGSAAGI
jgi:hypothetical protein